VSGRGASKTMPLADKKVLLQVLHSAARRCSVQSKFLQAAGAKFPAEATFVSGVSGHRESFLLVAVCLEGQRVVLSCAYSLQPPTGMLKRTCAGA
jgi:hypothetical protein